MISCFECFIILSMNFAIFDLKPFFHHFISNNAKFRCFNIIVFKENDSFKRIIFFAQLIGISFNYSLKFPPYLFVNLNFFLDYPQDYYILQAFSFIFMILVDDFNLHLIQFLIHWVNFLLVFLNCFRTIQFFVSIKKLQ